MFYKVYDTIANSMRPRDSLMLSYIINNSQLHGYCYASINTIAKALNINESTVRSSIKWLDKQDYIDRKEQKKGGLQQTNKLTPTYKTQALLAASFSAKYTAVKKVSKSLITPKTKTVKQTVKLKIQSLMVAKNCLKRGGYVNPAFMSSINDQIKYLNSCL